MDKIAQCLNSSFLNDNLQGKDNQLFKITDCYNIIKLCATILEIILERSNVYFFTDVESLKTQL